MAPSIDCWPRTKHSSRALVVVRWVGCAALALWCLFGSMRQAQAAGFAETIDRLQPRMVKVYGAGGLKGLEAYQSGFLISGEGHILTAWSYVLDADYVTAILDDGRALKAELLGADPRLEIAVLKIDVTGAPHFNLDEAVPGMNGARVLAFSNLFNVATGDEPTSVQHGVITAKASLAARRGVYETPYQGPAYVLDAMTNNPGAAGGALVDVSGNLLGVLGKELRNSQNQTWLNYAIPIEELKAAVAAIREGNYVPRTEADTTAKAENPITLPGLGIVLVPDVLERTPPFVDAVLPASVAAAAGLRPDDLIMFVGQRLTPSCKAVRRELEYLESGEEVLITVMRDQELLNFTLGGMPAVPARGE